jgi:hypothetical protein
VKEPHGKNDDCPPRAYDQGMDVTSYAKTNGLYQQDALMRPLTIAILCCWIISSMGCTLPSPVHKGPDTLSQPGDILSAESLDHPVDIVESDSQPQLPQCKPPADAKLISDLFNTWWWEGETNPQWAFEVGFFDVPCELGIEVNHDWLRVTHDEHMGTLKVELLAEKMPTGRHYGEVKVHPCSDELGSILEFDARIFKKPTTHAAAKVLVVGVDGVRPDALLLSDTPTMDMLVRHAAYSYKAHTQLTTKTKSGPGWSSVMTGVDADKHNVDSNLTEALEGHNTLYPSFLQRAHDALGTRTAAAAHWVPVLLLTPDEALDEVALGDDKSVTMQMEEFLYEGDFDLHFVHLDDPDAAGHSNGFQVDNELYIEAIENCDTHIHTLIDGILMRPTVAQEDWLIIVTTDHGGNGFDHGGMDSANQTIFLIVAGSTVIPENLPDGVASHMDVHPTVMDFLGLEPKADWNLDGHVRGLL